MCMLQAIKNELAPIFPLSSCVGHGRESSSIPTRNAANLGNSLLANRCLTDLPSQTGRISDFHMHSNFGNLHPRP